MDGVKHCDLRPIGYDQDGKCYPMDKSCKEVPEDVCNALRFAYEFSRYDDIRAQYHQYEKWIAKWDEEFGSKYPRTDCPVAADGKMMLCSVCGLCKTGGQDAAV